MKARFISRVGFPLMAWGLAFHSLVIAALFGLFGMPEQTVRAIAAWKELALIGLVAIVCIRALSGRGPRTEVGACDFWVAALIATAILYFVGEKLWLGSGLPFSGEMLGLRQTVYFMLMYFVGRASPELVLQDRVFRILVPLLVVTCVLGIVERFFLPPEGLVALGVASYFQQFLGLPAMTVGNEYGLPTNYWASIGGLAVRRAGSVYLSGQGFAVPFLLLFPVATTWVLSQKKKSFALAMAYAIVCVALLLTLTRMTIIVAVIQLLLFLFLKHKPEWGVAVLGSFAFLFLAGLVAVPGLGSFVLQTLSGQEPSTAGHLSDWWNGLLAFAERPWGYGLGTADQVSTRLGLEHITADNLYISYAVQLGLLGVSLLVLALGTILGCAYRVLRGATNLAEWRIGMTVFLATIGVAINGITSVVFNSIMLGWLFFWLAGLAVTLSQSIRLPKTVSAQWQLNVVE